jgi:4-amino-4-deoxy-L-arabinose transferase-like glycosyltransferase
MPALRRHWPFALVLAAAMLLRLGAAIAYRPALFYSDSWGYLAMAHGKGFVSFAPLRPSGYPIIVKVLSVFGDGLLAVTSAQHHAGLATGTLVYAALRHFDVARWAATLAAAVVLLDAWAIALEQYVLTEAFFALAIALSVWGSLTGVRGYAPARVSDRTPAVVRGGATYALAFAGLCLAAAALMRPVALFAVPAWIAWMVWVRPGGRPVLAGIAALAVPLLVYSIAHSSSVGSFGLTQAEGWFLYGRVGAIASCDGIDVEPAARKLCDRPARADHEEQSFFMFNRRSPARRAFGGISASSDRQARTNRILRHFALQVIAERPGDYLRLAGRDFLKFMRPGPRARYREDLTVAFPADGRIRFDDRPTRRRLFPSLATHADTPSALLRSYAKVFHTSRILVALITLASIGALAVGVRRRDPLVPAIFLPLAIALLMLAGAALTATFALRYLVPLVPELVIAGTLSGELLARARAGRRAALDASRAAVRV